MKIKSSEEQLKKALKDLLDCLAKEDFTMDIETAGAILATKGSLAASEQTDLERLLPWVDGKATEAIKLEGRYEAYLDRSKAERQGDMAEAFMVVCDYMAYEFGCKLPWCGRLTSWHQMKQDAASDELGISREDE